MNKEISYRVSLRIEGVDSEGNPADGRSARIELAEYGSYSQAHDFCYELVEHHVPEAAGERELLDEVESSGIYSAGD